jgi:hypothetical protein
MLPVPAKSSETRVILLLVSGETEHLWIRIENVVVKVRATSKKSLTDVRFGAHHGLTSYIVPGPKSADSVAKVPKCRAINFPRIDQTSLLRKSANTPGLLNKILVVHIAPKQNSKKIQSTTLSSRCRVSSSVMVSANIDVCSFPESRHSPTRQRCPFRAMKRHSTSCRITLDQGWQRTDNSRPPSNGSVIVRNPLVSRNAK